MLYMSEETKKGLHRVWQLKKILATEKTDFQEVVIADTPLGITLFCDGQRQSSEQSEKMYHEAMSYPGIWCSEGRKKAVVLGCSEGAAPKILRKFFETVIHIDIDMKCLSLCAKHLPYGYTEDELIPLATSRHLIFTDGKKWIEEQPDESIDLIVLDLPEQTDNESDQHNALYSESFFSTINQKLTANGALITEAGSPTLWRNDALKSLYIKFQKCFPSTWYFDLIEHEWSWLIGKKGAPLSIKDLEAKYLATLPAPTTIDWISFQKGTLLPKFLR